MPQGMGYSEDEILKLTQDVFPEFDGFEGEGMDDLPPLEPETPVGTEAPQELPPLIQSVASIPVETMASTPMDVKLEAIKMIIG